MASRGKGLEGSAEEAIAKTAEADKEPVSEKKARVVAEVEKNTFDDWQILAIRRRKKLGPLSKQLLELWYENDGKMPDGKVPLLGIIHDGEMCHIQPMPPNTWVDVPEDIRWQKGDYALLIMSELGEEAQTAFRVSGRELRGSSFGLFGRDLDATGRIAHVERIGDGDNEVALRKVVLDQKRKLLLLNPGNEEVKVDEICIRGVLKDFWMAEQEAVTARSS